ncbi:MAG TPA: hypothetical protein VGU27_03670, partial [Candidatus Eisenbacteria bacterium]|nr:hypothetical protein [Candidatus Eisenbacteria bacterium]
PARVAVAFALLWLAAFGFVTGPVAHVWSAYYYTLCAVGGAVLVALLARRLARWGWVALAAALVVWNAVGVAAPAFAVVENPWGWTSHLTPWYFARGAALSARLAAALGRAVPRPRPGTRFFFATLPPWAGFQTGNGPAIRHFYRDPSLGSWFYSQFSDTTAGDHPCVFLYWNGADFEPLYANARDPMFQVGADLLLLERPAGAAHAFRRALAAGGDPRDDLYWLGWAFLWSDRRAAAEQAWRAYGAKDDSSAHATWLTAARTAVADRDTLAARRALVEAIRAGIGRPVAHAELAALLRGVNAKYALLETLVAARLDPADWLARRDLVDGLVAAHLDEVAGRELAALQRIEPGWAADTVTARLAATLGGRSLAGRAVAEFGSVPEPEVGR